MDDESTTRPNFGPLQSFRVDLGHTDDVEKGIDDQLNAQDERLNHIERQLSDRYWNHMPIVHMLLNIHDSGPGVRALGKALVKIADMMEDRDKLVKRKSFLELARTDPNWIAGAVGKFDEDFDSMKGLLEDD